uniref:G-protein coupled receptors family 1 profile domain-containing protein n=1 Tax=Plectus sambesii TaxID=2011161 RepID=A0A914WEZ5_9BILA
MTSGASVKLLRIIGVDDRRRLSADAKRLTSAESAGGHNEAPSINKRPMHRRPLVLAFPAQPYVKLFQPPNQGALTTVARSATGSMVDCGEISNNASLFPCQEVDGVLEEDDDMARYTLRKAFCAAYTLLFVLGTVGNVAVIVMIVNVLTTNSRKQRTRNVSSSATHHVFIYVLGLSIVDLAVMLHLPLLVSDILMGEWMFGVFMCKLYWIIEWVNKLLSTFIMTVLSWDRFLAVCAPVRSLKMRSNSVAVVVLVACVAAATILLLPVIVKSTVSEVDRSTSDTVEGSNLTNTLTKCIFAGDNNVFTLYTFVCGFALPALLMIVFYSRVICTLRQSAEAVRRYNVQLHHAHNPRLQQVGTVPPSSSASRYSAADRSLAGFNRPMSLTVTANHSPPDEDSPTSDVTPYRRNGSTFAGRQLSKEPSTPSPDVVEMEETMSLMRTESLHNNNNNSNSNSNGALLTELISVA